MTVALLSGCDRSAPAVGPDYGRTPVLFVHGHGLSSDSWTEMIRHLVNVGYPRDYLSAVNIVPSDIANPRAATTVIEPAATALLARAKATADTAGYQRETPRRLDIVSHSMGAVSSRWYAAKLHPERVRTFIALAGANHGTNALCRLKDEGSREMCPAFEPRDQQRSVQAELNGTPDTPRDETPYGLGPDPTGIPAIPPDSARSILYLTVRVEPDQWIKPERSALLSGAAGRNVPVPPGVRVKESPSGNFLFLRRADHDSLLKHPELLRLVTAMLAVRDGE